MRTEEIDRQLTIEKIIRETEWVTPARMADLPLARWRREGRIFSVDIDRSPYYARYQFDDSYEPLPIIADILKEFRGAIDGTKIAAWFHFPNAYLQAEGCWAIAPKDALDQPKELMHALRSRTGAYVA